MSATIIKERLAEVCERPLAKGKHDPDGEACLLEAVAYVAGEEWSDHPECVCPVLAAFGRSWNDSLKDDDRQMLKPYIPRLVGTRSTPEVESRRSWMAVDWLVREYTPAWLRLAGLTTQAEQVEALAQITDTASAKATHKTLNGARKDAAGDAAGDAAWIAARDAAWDAAWAAAGDAAGDAAWAAAGDAAWDAAWIAARDAAWDAAWIAARDAAWIAARDAAGDAAWAAAWDAAGDALAPTVKALQASALALLDRMIDA